MLLSGANKIFLDRLNRIYLISPMFLKRERERERIDQEWIVWIADGKTLSSLRRRERAVVSVCPCKSLDVAMLVCRHTVEAMLVCRRTVEARHAVAEQQVEGMHVDRVRENPRDYFLRRCCCSSDDRLRCFRPTMVELCTREELEREKHASSFSHWSVRTRQLTNRDCHDDKHDGVFASEHV